MPGAMRGAAGHFNLAQLCSLENVTKMANKDELYTAPFNILTGWTWRVGSSSSFLMGAKNPERVRLWGSPHDLLSKYARGYTLVAYCQRLGCGHSRDLHTALLLRVFGKDATMGQVAAHLRCYRCQQRGPRIEARYHGPSGDPRR
jgi:hypothetical protein